VIGIYLSLGVFAIQVVAFAGGLIAVAVVYAIGAAVRSRDPILVLVLTGVVVGSLFGAGVGLVKYLADPYNQLPAMTFWLLGSLSATGVADLLPLFGPVALGAAVLIALRWRMNVMSLPRRKRALLASPPGRCASPSSPPPPWSHRRASPPPESSAGSGWWCRIWHDRWSVRILRAVAGGCHPRRRLSVADRHTGAHHGAVEIPLGILTAVIGTPFFIWLLTSVQKNWS